MDRLVVLDQGRIVEEGRTRNCSRSGGLYAALWSRQSGGFLDLEPMPAASRRHARRQVAAGHDGRR